MGQKKESVMDPLHPDLPLNVFKSWHFHLSFWLRESVYSIEYHYLEIAIFCQNAQLFVDVVNFFNQVCMYMRSLELY